MLFFDLDTCYPNRGNERADIKYNNPFLLNRDLRNFS